MSIPFSCPHCGHFTRVEVRYAGQTGSCTSCDKNITVPTPEQAAQSQSGFRLNGPVSEQKEPTDRAHSQSAPKNDKKSNSLAWLAGYAALAIVAAATMLWLVFAMVLSPRRHHAIDREGSCEANLHRIGRAIESYYQEHGCFPCSTNQESTEQPKHSWRVALLPHLHDQRLYKSVKSQNGWQGLQDQQFQRARPSVYAAPDDDTLSDLETSYFAIVGNQTGIASESSHARRKEEFTDGLSNTILLIEARGQAVRWIESRDLNVANLEWGVNAKQNGIGSHHSLGGAHVLMASGDVYWLDETTPPEVLLAMTTIDGGESVDIERWLKR